MKDSKRVPILLLENKPSRLMSDIVLFGDGNCGKSTTLHHLIVLLSGGGVLNPSIQVAYEKAFKEPTKNHLRDVDVFINYQSEYGTIPIYVSTDGDSWPIVEDNFRFFYHCPRTKHKIYEFNGSNFVECIIKKKPNPQFCISPANYNHFGGIQAHRYYLDVTCEDWKRERWIKKEKGKKTLPLVKGYKILKVYKNDAGLAQRIIQLIHQMLLDKII